MHFTSHALDITVYVHAEREREREGKRERERVKGSGLTVLGILNCKEALPPSSVFDILSALFHHMLLLHVMCGDTWDTCCLCCWILWWPHTDSQYKYCLGI